LSEKTCPHCGSEITLRSALAKLIQCNHCASTVLVEPAGVRLSNIKSTIQSKLSLIKQGGNFTWKHQQFQPQGFIQLKYDEGFRQEWWVLDNNENSYWLSEEDESFFLLQDAKISDEMLKDIPPWLTLQVNKQIQLVGKSWLVTEKRTQHYYGFEGELPYIPDQKETINTTYLTGENAESLVLIFENNKPRIRQGYWLDPFEINVQGIAV